MMPAGNRRIFSDEISEEISTVFEGNREKDFLNEFLEKMLQEFPDNPKKSNDPHLRNRWRHPLRNQKIK